MANLAAELPDDLYWVKDQVESLVRPGAFLKPAPASKKTMPWIPGSTCVGGLPDVPRDALWLDAVQREQPFQSPKDGPAFWLQLNLEEIPLVVRKPEWPNVGVVWVFIDVSDHWKATVHFDARPAKEISWMPYREAFPCMELEPPYFNKQVTWTVVDTLPCCTEEILPEVSCVDYTAESFDEWVWKNYRSKQPSHLQVGGWVWPIQGDVDEKNPDFVCAMERQEFGDSSAVYLYYTPKDGFWGELETH